MMDSQSNSGTGSGALSTKKSAISLWRTAGPSAHKHSTPADHDLHKHQPEPSACRQWWQVPPSHSKSRSGAWCTPLPPFGCLGGHGCFCFRMMPTSSAVASLRDCSVSSVRVLQHVQRLPFLVCAYTTALQARPPAGLSQCSRGGGPGGGDPDVSLEAWHQGKCNRKL